MNNPEWTGRNYNPEWLAAREAGILTRIETLKKGECGINIFGDEIRMSRSHGSHDGVYFMMNLRTGVEGMYAGCAEVLRKD
jgi:hypothetical protein